MYPETATRGGNGSRPGSKTERRQGLGRVSGFAAAISRIACGFGAILLIACASSSLSVSSSVSSSESLGQLTFDKRKTEKPLPNPSIMTASRDEVLAKVKQMFETKEIPLDKEDCTSKTTGECILISKPIIFVKGITAKSQLEHYCEVPAADVKNWARGRYVLRVQVAPAAIKTAQVAIFAKFDGMVEGVGGTEWEALTSKGVLEDTIMKCLDSLVRTGECKPEGQ